MLVICKKKQMACKLYLDEQPEKASRIMLQYLSDLEHHIKQPRDYANTISVAFTLFLGFAIIGNLLPFNSVVLYFLFMAGFIVAIFLVPYVTNRKHIEQTKAYITKEILPELNKKINDFKSQIQELNKRIEDELKSSTNKNGGGYKSSGYKLDRVTALQTLGLENNASFIEVKKAFRKQIIETHPDRNENLSEREREIAEQKTIRLNQAYSYLKSVMN